MADLYRARATLTINGVASLITTYWSTSASAPDGPSATEALARVRAMFNSAAAKIPGGSTLTFDTAVQILDDATGTLVNAATATAPTAVTFSGIGDPLPAQTQGLLRFTTGNFVRGRNVKGRMFIPGPAEGDNSSTGGPATAYLTAWNTAAGLLGTTIVTPISQVVWSRPTGPGASDGVSSGVSGRSMASTWAVQRGRRS
jgi:hypothetical protein